MVDVNLVWGLGLSPMPLFLKKIADQSLTKVFISMTQCFKLDGGRAGLLAQLMAQHLLPITQCNILLLANSL